MELLNILQEIAFIISDVFLGAKNSVQIGILFSIIIVYNENFCSE